MPLGPGPDGSFAVHAPAATAVWVCLFDAADKETGRIRLQEHTGDVWHGRVPGLHAGARYGLRTDRAPQKLLIDPYATRLDRVPRLHPSMSAAGLDSAPHMPKAVVETRSEAPPPPLMTGPRVVMELHVRGFTITNPAIPEAIRGTFAGLAHPAAIAHLRRLGVTHVELLPCAAWIEERHLPPLGLTNYWGYNPIAFLAPDPRLAPGGLEEIRDAVAALRAAGIGTILDVVFNHTGESDAHGPTLSLRGLDEGEYYRMRNGVLVNDTGCGNTLRCDRPAVVRLVMDALRSWVLRTGVEGFRFDLATILGRSDSGFCAEAPLLIAMRQDPLLRDRLLIMEPWDPGRGGYHLGAFAPGQPEWNDRFRDDLRRFWRGEGGMLSGLATRLAGSADIFAARRRPVTDSLNFLTAHDGFSLADLVAYNDKHNEANGEHNRDGTDANHSWNNGAEGPTDDPAILARRIGDIRALLTLLLVARGTPMLSMGDEAGRSQGGNNNAYAQDNALSWFDWQGMDQALVDFAARLVAARLAHSALHAEAWLTGEGSPPDVAWLRLDGVAMSAHDWQETHGRSLLVALCLGEDRVLVAIQGAEAGASAVLPPSRGWRILTDSADPAREGPVAGRLALAARSVVLLAEDRGA